MPHRALEERLGYCFSDRKLLEQALTHPSANPRSPHRIIYERLEFLGDAVLELVVSDRLYALIPDQPEGVLTQLRARVVSRDHLAQIARDLELDRYVILGKGEEGSGGRTRESTLANTFETVFGAIYLDSDYVTARSILLTTLGASIAEVTSDLKENNPKGELQAELQNLFPETPAYIAVEQDDPDPAKRFHASVNWRQQHLGSGYGPSKRRAEVDAATDALKHRRWES